jgi:hypothetical protein
MVDHVDVDCSKLQRARVAPKLHQRNCSFLSGEITDEIHVCVAAGRARRSDSGLVPLQPSLIACRFECASQNRGRALPAAAAARKTWPGLMCPLRRFEPGLSEPGTRRRPQVYGQLRPAAEEEDDEADASFGTVIVTRSCAASRRSSSAASTTATMACAGSRARSAPSKMSSLWPPARARSSGRASACCDGFPMLHHSDPRH